VKELICTLIGHHVAARRVQRQLTQEAVAYQVGVSRQALSEIERGTQAPRWETLYVLAEVLRCEVYDLLPTVKQVRGRA
jgi:DNA-binding XRE family transcriptional regulator